MKKVIMIIGIAVMGVAIVVGLQNKGSQQDANQELADTKEKVRVISSELGGLEGDVVAATKKEVQAKDKRNQASAAIEGVKQELKIVARSVDDVSAELKKIEIELKENKLVVQKMFPDGVVTTLEALRTKSSGLDDELTEKQNVVANLDAQFAQANQSKQVQVTLVKKEEEHQVKRAQKLALNGMVATVIAVNKEWGFVMVNAGRAHGVGGESSLLVKRGNSRVARLRIVNLQDTVSVCDVVKDSMVKGVRIQPGDKVIFENAGGL